MNRQYIVDSLCFWEALPDDRKKDDEARALETKLRGAIGRMDDDTLSHFTDIALRQYAEQAATQASVASRGSALLLFVGVVSTGATVVAGSLTTSAPLLLGVTLLVGGCLLYACLAVAFLAVRAQEVATWTVPAIYPRDATAARTVAVEEASQHAFAYEQNKAGLQHLVAYLADAQRWARRAIVLVVTLALLSVASAATKPAPASLTGAPVSSLAAVPSTSAYP
jgi:hypothetical protein